MDGFERSLVALVNKILPQAKAKDKEQLVVVLPYWLIVLNILGILLLATEAAKDAGASAAFYVTCVALSALMIVGAVLMKKHSLLGWRIAFYALAASFVTNIVALNILGIILPGFFLYVFIQIREKYF